jgi:hypothetical protein
VLAVEKKKEKEMQEMRRESIYQLFLITTNG